jgi:hypothetical protein
VAADELMNGQILFMATSIRLNNELILPASTSRHLVKALKHPESDGTKAQSPERKFTLEAEQVSPAAQ